MEIAGCALPDDRLYDLENEVWWQEEGGLGTARLGLIAAFTAFAGPIRELRFRAGDGIVAAGRSVATIESHRLVAPVRLPVAAEVVARNEALTGAPRQLNDAPYSGAWIVRLRPARPIGPADPLRPAAAIAAALEEEIRRRRVQCWPKSPESELAEIGLECSAVLAKLSEEVARRADGEAVLLVTDDPTAPIEMVRWSDRTGHRLLAHRREGSIHRFLVERRSRGVPGAGRP